MHWTGTPPYLKSCSWILTRVKRLTDDERMNGFKKNAQLRTKSQFELMFNLEFSSRTSLHLTVFCCSSILTSLLIPDPEKLPRTMTLGANESANVFA